MNHGFTTNKAKKHGYYSKTIVTTMVFATLTNHSLTMVFVVKLRLYKCNTHKKNMITTLLLQ